MRQHDKRDRDASTQTFKPEFTCFAKQLRPDLALLEIGYENSIRAAGQQPGQIALAHSERKFPQIIAIEHQGIERVKLHFLVMLT
jgi:hypothetical protein